MKRIKKRYVNLVIVCLFFSVFVSVSCIVKGIGSSLNVINSFVNIVNSFILLFNEFNIEYKIENVVDNRNRSKAFLND